MARFQWVRSPGVAWLGMYLWFKVSLEVSVKLSARVVCSARCSMGWVVWGWREVLLPSSWTRLLAGLVLAVWASPQGALQPDRWFSPGKSSKRKNVALVASLCKLIWKWHPITFAELSSLERSHLVLALTRLYRGMNPGGWRVLRTT